MQHHHTKYVDQGMLHGGNNNDILHADTLGDHSEIHTFAGGGNDLLILSFQKYSGTISGHHARGGDGNDTFAFEIGSHMDGICVGRLEDFDVQRDKILVNGERLKLFDLPSWATIYEYNGRHNDQNAEAQQWLHLQHGTAEIFYALEGARVDMNGDGLSNEGDQELHFVKSPPNLASLKEVDFKNPFNVVPIGYSRKSGIIYNDEDHNSGDVKNVILGSTRGDALAGGLNGDKLFSKSGQDHVWGGSGFDTINLGSGNDYGYGNSGNDRVSGGNGKDKLYGGEGKDKLFGASKGDFLSGQTGHDFLKGGAGSDKLHGGTGNDRLSGGKGNDMLFGGPGSDTFVFSDGKDRVKDFQINIDRIFIDSDLIGRGESKSDLYSYFDTHHGDGVFDFGNGDVLYIEDAAQLKVLIDDIVLF